MSGTQDIVIAAGVESMTRVPMGLSVSAPAQFGIGAGSWSRKIKQRYGVEGFSQFHGAQLMVDKYGFTRDELDACALESHLRAAGAATSGTFDEVVGLEVTTPDGGVEMHLYDEGIRFDATLASIGGVKPIQEGGSITAANASQICDGAADVLIVSERALKAHGLTPMARVDTLVVSAGDPIIMLEEPIPATQKALARSGKRIEDIDLYEVNEAFAPVPLAWLKVIGADNERLNVNGGAIALGHPLGASGAKLMTTLIHALKARGGRWGLQAMCEGGGIANLTIIEAV